MSIDLSEIFCTTITAAKDKIRIVNYYRRGEDHLIKTGKQVLKRQQSMLQESVPLPNER